MAFRRGLHVGAYAAEPQQLDFRLQQALDEFVRRHAVLGKAEAVLHLRRPFDGLGAALENRPDERRVGKECVRTCSSRRSPSHYKTKTIRSFVDHPTNTK